MKNRRTGNTEAKYEECTRVHDNILCTCLQNYMVGASPLGITIPGIAVALYRRCYFFNGGYAQITVYLY